MAIWFLMRRGREAEIERRERGSAFFYFYFFYLYFSAFIFRRLVCVCFPPSNRTSPVSAPSAPVGAMPPRSASRKRPAPTESKSASASKEEEQRGGKGKQQEPSTLTTTSNKKKAKRSPSASAPAPVARKPSSPPPQYVGDSSSSDDEDESTKKKSVVSLGNVVPFERKKQRRQKTDAIDAAADDGDADASPTDGVTDAPPPRSTPRVSLENILLQAVAQGKPGPCAMEGGIDEDDDVAEVDVEADDLDERSGGGAAAAAANATANATTSATPRDWVASGGATGDFAPCPLGRTTLLFDLNGVLLVNPRDPATGRREPRLRPGVEHLARLCGRFRLGVYSSATLQTVRRATSAVVFGMMAGNGGSQQQQQQQVFELMLCRQHCRPAPQVREFVFFYRCTPSLCAILVALDALLLELFFTREIKARKRPASSKKPKNC